MDLPDDIVVEIAAHLPNGKSVVNLQLSSRRIYSLLSTRIDVWRNLCAYERLSCLAPCFPEFFQISSETINYEKLFKGIASCDLLCGSYEHRTGLFNAGECEWRSLTIANSDCSVSSVGLLVDDIIDRKYQGLCSNMTPEELDSRRSGFVDLAVDAIKNVFVSKREDFGVCKRCKVMFDSYHIMNEGEDSVVCRECARVLCLSGRRSSWDLHSYEYEEDDEEARKLDSKKRLELDEGIFNLLNQTCLEAAEASSHQLPRYFKFFRYKITASDEYSDYSTFIQGIVFFDENNSIKFIGKDMGRIVRSRLCMAPFYFSNTKFISRAEMLPMMSKVRSGGNNTSLMLQAQDLSFSLVRKN
jgi:hypothetical protein